MKTGIRQREQVPGGAQNVPPEAGGAPNVAARMGRWSAQHRKAAIWGWLAFVVIAFAIGGAVGTTTLDNAHLGVGESGRADLTVDAAYPESADEMVLVQSPTASAD